MNEQTTGPAKGKAMPKRGETMKAAGAGIMDGAAYLESLRDGREVWIRGEKIADVTTHPATARVAQEMARVYDLQHDPATRDIMSLEDDDGVRVSYSYLAPKTPEKLLARRRNTEVWARQTFGMCGRFPDFCASIVVGMYDVRHELAALDPQFGKNITAYLKFAAQNDLSLSHGLHDPAMDKSLRPEQDPDRCLRIVKERDDGIIVRGTRMVTLGPLTDELLIAPTYPLNEREREFAVWFAIPVAAPGIKQICREPYTMNRDARDHMLSSRFDEQDALVVFDDVFIPWERVFLAYAPAEAMRLFRGRVMAWASYSSVLQLLARVRLIIGTAYLVARTEGKEMRPHVVREMGELITIAQIFESIIRAAEVDCVTTPGGHYTLANAPHLRAFIVMSSERIVSILEHVGTSALVFVPSAEDLDVPELRPHIDLYGRGKDVDALTRQRLCKLAWELTCDSFAGRQQLYERLHSGPPEMVVGNAYRSYDMKQATEMVWDVLGIDDPGLT